MKIYLRFDNLQVEFFKNAIRLCELATANSLFNFLVHGFTLAVNPSALSMEEQRLLASLERLNSRLEEVESTVATNPNVAHYKKSVRVHMLLLTCGFWRQKLF